jgi:hypothetical protein
MDDSGQLQPADADDDDPLNPWDIDKLDQYLYYCCPQCTHRCKDKPMLMSHAYVNHPDVSKYLK